MLSVCVPKVRSSKLSLRSKALDHELAERDARKRQAWSSSFSPQTLRESSNPEEAATKCQMAFHKDCNALCLDCMVYGQNLKRTFVRFQGVACPACHHVNHRNP